MADDLLARADNTNERLKSTPPSDDAMEAATDLVDDLADAVRSLRDQLDAADAVIRRLVEAWSARERAGGTIAWRADSYYPPKWEPMTPAEHAAIARVTGEQP